MTSTLEPTEKTLGLICHEMHVKDGMSDSEIARALAHCYGIQKTKGAVCGLRYRFRQELVDDLRDLEICAEIDAGRAHVMIAAAHDVSLDHVSSLAREIAL